MFEFKPIKSKVDDLEVMELDLDEKTQIIILQTLSYEFQPPARSVFDELTKDATDIDTVIHAYVQASMNHGILKAITAKIQNDEFDDALRSLE